MEKGKFYIDNIGIFEGYANGNEYPYFTKEQALKVIKAVDNSFEYDKANDKFIVEDRAYYEAEVPGFDCNGMHLYNFSNLDWPWEKGEAK